MFTLFTGLLLLGVAAAREVQVCDTNEQYSSCGTYCPQTCNDYASPKACPDVCAQGCFCLEGFVRRSVDGECVPVEACKDVPQCMENEELTECGWLCQPTCNNNAPQNCSDGCVETCVCKKGYIRSAVDGPCVPQDSCSQEICKANEVYKDCGTACPGTCSQPLRVCERKCVAGCFCQEGYVLDDQTNECVPVDSCPNNFS
jgi:hypothetical protein